MKNALKTERKLNRLLSAAGIFLAVLSIMLINALCVTAAETKGSLTLSCVFSIDGSSRILSDDEYSLAKIADASFTDSSVIYTTLEQFGAYDCDWQNTAASEMNEKAKALAYYCGNNHYYTVSAVTDRSGSLRFEGLKAGLYLVARTKTDPANEDLITDPLLVFIPETVNGSVIYDVVCTPKFSYFSQDDPIPPDVPDSPSGGDLPQTGQLMWPVTVLAVLGCFLILGGSALLREEGSDEKKTR